MSTQNRIPVYFSKKMVAANEAAFSPSAAKPGPVFTSWMNMMGPDLEHHENFYGATRYEFARAHDPKFVCDVLSGRDFNGFSNKDMEVARALPYTTGAMMAAARHAWINGGVAVAPCSGFHHAGYDRVGGFCTFNGLMVTAMDLLASGAKKIGILDLDMHYGNGTDDIIDRLNVFGSIVHFTGGSHFHHPEQGASFFKALPAIMRLFEDCDVVLYQAGADSNVNDPLGGYLTTHQQYQRDQRVFTALSRMQVPCAWNLAGGYQKELDGSIPKVLDIHDGTMRACAEVYLNGIYNAP
jgi:acetoin utilization deacetylase AcuC-like enzyme